MHFSAQKIIVIMSCFRRLFDLGVIASRIFLVEFVNPELAF